MPEGSLLIGDKLGTPDNPWLYGSTGPVAEPEGEAAGSSPFLESFGGLGPSHVLPEGTELLQQGQFPRQVSVIEEGLVKLNRVNEEGKEVILGLRTKGWPLGTSPVLCKCPCPYSATALTRSRIIHVSVQRFLRQMDKDPQFCLYLNHLCNQEIISHVEQISDLALSSARRRLERLLGHLITLQYAMKQRTALPIRIPLKQVEIAQIIAVTPCYLSQLIARLEKEGIVSRRRGWLLVPDPEILP